MAGRGREIPGEPGEPGRGREIPGAPGRGREIPGEPGEPGRGREIPGEPGEPGRGREIPGEPGRGREIPGEPGRGREIPGEPGEPGRGREIPGEPGEPGRCREIPGAPGRGREIPGEPGEPGDPGRGREIPGRGQEIPGEPGRGREIPGEPGRGREIPRDPGRSRESFPSIPMVVMPLPQWTGPRLAQLRLNPSIRRSAIPTPRDATTFGKDKLFRERSRTLPSRKAAGPDGSDSVTPTGKPQTVSAPRAGSEGAEQSRLRIQVRELLAEAQVKELEMGRLRCELKRQQDKHRKQLPEEKWGSDNIESQLLELQEKTRGFQQEVQDPRTEKGVLQERLLSLEQLREAAESDTDGNSLSLDVSPNSDPGNSLQTPSSLDRNRTRGPDNTSMAINGVQSHSLISHTNSGTPSLHSVGCDTALDPPTIGSNGLQAIPHSSDASSEGLMKDMAEKIEQMEQKHHSTAEELQATLQELSDQQLLLQELTAENEKLLEEKRTLEVSLQQQAARQKVSQDGQRVSRGSEIGDSAEPDQDKLPVSNCWSLEQEQPGTDLLVKSLREKVRNLQLLLEAEREGNASNTETRPNCHHEYSEQANQMELENQKKEELKVGEGAAEMGMLQEVLRETQCEKERLQLECSALRETSRQNTSEIIRLHSLVVK
ncbi:hypothetical protein scyTo_0023892, partial [Scyliorhinus torazame]|nr:hypothetical protein [Scyliorhinus torazame]